MQANFISTSAIVVSGTDAEKFLQGQMTCDVRKSNDTTPMTAAICNNKGRVIAAFWLWKKNDDFWMIVPEDLHTTVLEILKKYGRFSKVTFATPASHDFLVPKLDECIQAGFAVITKADTEKFTPNELAYTQNDTVDFHKGCFVGQEIIARIHYRGKTKMHLYHVVIKDMSLSNQFDVINAIEKENGEIEALVVGRDLPDEIEIIKSYV